MNYLITENSVSFLNTDSIKVLPSIPVGIYKTVFDRMRGTYLEKAEVKLSHGKVYGQAQNIANHIVEAYKKNSPDRNLGVLFSGDKGLGKTLTSRLVIESLYKDKPIIIISDYTPDLADFLTNIKGCVIFMDEFEKFMSGSLGNPDDDDAQTKQETILSILDGNTSSCGNLYLLTVNNLYKVDDNLKSRPGRIKYHYKFKSENAATVREYCADNLINKENIENVVKVLGSTKFVSMDIISSFVDELNAFPDETPEEALKIFNVEQSDDSIFNIAIKVLWDNKTEVVYHHRTSYADLFDNDWYSANMKSGKAREKILKFDIPENMRFTLDESIDLNPYAPTELEAFEIKPDDDIDDEYISRMKILGGIIKDEQNESFMRRYNPAAI